MKGDPNLEDMESTQGEQSETIKDRGSGKQNEVSEGSRTDAAEISILGGGGHVEIPPDTKMQVAAVNKVLRAQNGKGKLEFFDV